MAAPLVGLGRVVQLLLDPPNADGLDAALDDGARHDLEREFSLAAQIVRREQNAVAIFLRNQERLAFLQVGDYLAGLALVFLALLRDGNALTNCDARDFRGFCRHCCFL